MWFQCIGWKRNWYSVRNKFKTKETGKSNFNRHYEIEDLLTYNRETVTLYLLLEEHVYISDQNKFVMLYGTFQDTIIAKLKEYETIMKMKKFWK